ncbi:MAG: hypothetical protein DI539_06485 [Flavobacterium psychrophilum]|nr:MAG: hypothetical protein DI539_06485 [Flavobacterium psychrophilum]
MKVYVPLPLFTVLTIPFPVAPVAPAAPAVPCAPVAPATPVAPVAPCGPLKSEVVNEVPSV